MYLSVLGGIQTNMITAPPSKWTHYSTNLGVCINKPCEQTLNDFLLTHYKNQIQLIFTSPPFPLNRAKNYGNLKGQEYKEWLCEIGKKMIPLLTGDGSIVIEIGNAWNAGQPTFSTLPIETLLEFKNLCGLYLCQEFIYYNPARLPSPIQWVNKERIRVKDSFTRLWWMSTSPKPYSNNNEVLEPYSQQMKKLLDSGKYNSGQRPSEHNISSTAFFRDNGGAIPSNVIIASNTDSNSKYLKACKKLKIPIHPARMPQIVPNFFIKMLTKAGDIIFDPFAGSNTTGYCAEILNRRWISCEIDSNFYNGSKLRF